jgi:hypothetical protein
MRGHGWLVLGLAGATVGLVLALTLTAGGHRIALSVYVLVVAGLVVTTLARAVRDELGPAPRSLFDPPRTEGRPRGQLGDLEADVAAAGNSGFLFELQLRPLLFQAAAYRARRRGVDVERHPDALRPLVGDEAWELLRPDRRGERRGLRANGISEEQLLMLVDAVERLR